MVGRCCDNIAGVPTAAVNKCFTIAEIGVWIAWITEARFSCDVDTLEEVADTLTTVEETLVMKEPVDVEAEEETAGNELSRLFLVRLGGVAHHKKRSGPQKAERQSKMVLTHGDQITRRISGANRK